VHAAPLLEKERHSRLPALVAEVDHPRGVHGPRPRSRLAADDHPVDVPQVMVAKTRWINVSGIDW
jgi:hypothetical protein